MSNPGETPTKLQFQWGGEAMEFESFSNCLSRVTAETILSGRTYPLIPFVRDVSVVMDIGGNVGAAAVFFSLAYPDATIFAFEPASMAYRLLRANTDARANVHVHNFGLYSSNVQVPLYRGTYDSGMSSIAKSESTRDQSEQVTLRSVREWLEENSISTIDVLKIDSEGCEVPILEALKDLLPSVKVIYLEYHSDDDRKEFDRLLGDTHLLMHGQMMVHLGEVTYVAKDAFQSESELDRRPIKLEL
ncbi:MAG: FkbM family methyltransferase [Aeromicrobium sp.]